MNDLPPRPLWLAALDAFAVGNPHAVSQIKYAIRLGETYAACVVLIHGPGASGKTYVADLLCEALGGASIVRIVDGYRTAKALLAVIKPWMGRRKLVIVEMQEEFGHDEHVELLEGIARIAGGLQNINLVNVIPPADRLHERPFNGQAKALRDWAMAPAPRGAGADVPREDMHDLEDKEPADAV